MSLTRSAVAVVENSGRRCVSSFLCAAATRGEQSALKPSRTTASVSTRSTPRQVTTSRSFTTATAAQLLRNSSSSSSASHDLSETPSHAPDSDEDVVIIGGGVVGLSLACSLVSSRSFASSGNSLTLIEASDLDKLRTWADAKQQRREQAANEERPSAEDGIDWENRVIYLTEENRAWLDDIGVSQYLDEERLGPIHSMHVTDGLTGAALDFDVNHEGLQMNTQRRMGTMVEISNLQQAMLRYLDEAVQRQATPITILQNTKVSHIEASMGASTKDPWPTLTLNDDGAQKPQKMRARLLVGADGHNSPVRSYAGIGAFGWSYDRKGLVGTLRHRSSAAGFSAEEEDGDFQSTRTAFQRFLPTGTIAWLPLSDNTSSMVWTLPPKTAEALTKMHRATAIQNGQTSPLAHLITAAFRLPFAALDEVLQRIVAQGEGPNQDEDWSWVVASLEEHLIASFSASSSSANLGTAMTESEVPPPVASVDIKSVASFPLRLSHADAYLGSSLADEADVSTSGAAALTPSFFLNKTLTLLNLNNASGSSGIGKDNNGADVIARARTALVGDAAHTIHPLAGQGLNLGLADARSLSETLERASERGADLGTHSSLSEYPRDRYLANQAVLSAVDHLHWLFVVPPPREHLSAAAESHAADGVVQDNLSRAVIWARSTGFEVLNELGVVKRAITSFAGSSSSKRR